MKTADATSMKRTVLAMVLTLAAVAAPCAAWFVAGWRDVQRQMAAEINRPNQQAREAANRLAEQFGMPVINLAETTIPPKVLVASTVSVKPV